MASVFKLFTQFEDVQTRDRFTSDIGITLDNFHSLVGAYNFPGQVRCQVNSTGNICGHHHNNGWLGVTKDGKEVLIGGDCAVKYFRADKRFSTQASQIKREIRTEELLETLRRYLADRAGFIATVDHEIERLRDLKLTVDALFDKLGFGVRQTLIDMDKIGKRTVYVQIRYRKEDQDGKDRSDWVDHPIGSVMGTGVTRPEEFRSVITDLRALKAVLQEVRLSQDAGGRKLKKWADQISALPELRSRIDGLIQEYRQLTQTQTLNLLVFLVRSENHQLTIAKTILKQISAQESGDNAARLYLKELKDSIRASNGNRDIRTHR